MKKIRKVMALLVAVAMLLNMCPPSVGAGVGIRQTPVSVGNADIQSSNDDTGDKSASNEESEVTTEASTSTEGVADEKNNTSASEETVADDEEKSTSDTEEDKSKDKKDENKDSDEDEKMPAFSETKAIDGVKITVAADKDVFPKGVTLSIRKVSKADGRNVDKAIDKIREDGVNVAAAYTFDIKIVDKDGNEIQPADGKKVRVSFEAEEVGNDNLAADIYHITGKGKKLSAEMLDSAEHDDKVTASTGGFSLYTVEFTYDEIQYVMEGDTSVALSDILDEVGLTGEVTGVEVSDDSLFSAKKKDGKWMVTAHKAFSTTEWMKVTIDGVVYEIVVTDAQTIMYNELNVGDFIQPGTTVSFGEEQGRVLFTGIGNEYTFVEKTCSEFKYNSADRNSNEFIIDGVSYNHDTWDGYYNGKCQVVGIEKYCNRLIIKGLKDGDAETVSPLIFKYRKDAESENQTSENDLLPQSVYAGYTNESITVFVPDSITGDKGVVTSWDFYSAEPEEFDGVTYDYLINCLETELKPGGWLNTTLDTAKSYVFVPHWGDYKVVFDTNGVESVSFADAYPDSDGYVTLPTSVGGTYGEYFRFWSTDPYPTSELPSYYQRPNDVSDKIITLYANWYSIRKLKYDANGGTFISSGTDTYEDPKNPYDWTYPTSGSGIATILDGDKLTHPEGKSFKEWNTKADGTGTTYTAGATLDLKGLTYNTVLYAQWESAEPAASVTSGSTTTDYGDFSAAVSAWNSAESGATLKLIANVTTGSTVSVSGTKTLDLNGYGIKMTGSGSVISVTGGASLTLKDSNTDNVTHRFTIADPSEKGAGLATVNDALESGYKTFMGGYITGGSASQGGGVYVAGGTFNMTGGNIIGNKTTAKGYYEGGGVALSNNTDSRFIMTGGTIQYNTSIGRGGGLGIENNATADLSGDAKIMYNGSTDNDWGGGISSFGTLNISGNVKVMYNKGGSAVHPQQGSINVSGSPVIYDNEVSAGNILPDVKINVAGTLAESAKFGIYYNAGVFTTGDNAADYASNFTSDNDSYIVGKNADGQLYLGVPVAVSFNTNDGSTVESQTVASGSMVTKPYDPTKEGYAFVGWYKEATFTTEWDFDRDTVTEDTTIYAKWKQVYSVTLTGGANSSASPSDKTTQTGLTGVMTTVTYTANDGYYFGELTTVLSRNGITVTRADDGKTITVSGTPTADVNIIIPDAVEKYEDLEYEGITFKPWTKKDSMPSEAGNYYLIGDVTLTVYGDALWATPSGTTRLCLNGKTIDLAGNNEIKNGSADSHLIIYDNIGTGKIKTSLAENDGCLMYLNKGKMTLNSGTIVGNQKAGQEVFYAGSNTELIMNGGKIISESGKGECAVNLAGRGSKFTMTGGEIDIPEAPNGVIKNANGTVNISGGSKIIGNSYVYLDDGKTININGALSSDAEIRIKMKNPGVFTNSSNVDYNDPDRFVSVDEEYKVFKNSDGQLALGVPISKTVTFKVVNGSWNDGETTDKTIILSGYEAEALKLTASQIPAAGDNPNATYKAGNWDTTPSADAVITADTTYTYTYAEKISITPTVSISGWKYGGTASTPSVSGNTGNGEVAYTYAKKGTTDFSETVPSIAGEYTVKAVIAETDNYLGGEATADFTITKAEVTAPTIANKNYTGDKQTADVETSDLYNVTTNNGGTDVGSYDVVLTLKDAVNYKWTDSEEAAKTLTFKIVTATANNVTVDIEGWTYGEAAKTPTSTADFGADTATYTYSSSENGEYSDAVPTDAGTWYVKASIAETDNYPAGEAKTSFVIEPAAITIMADDKSTVYNEELAELTYTIGGSYVEDDDLGITLSTTAAKGSEPGDYPITVSWKENPNYDVALEDGQYTITKGGVSITVSGYSGKYDGKAHGITVKELEGESGELIGIFDGESPEATVYYSTKELGKDNYKDDGSKESPTFTDAGKYTVYYYVQCKGYTIDPISGSKTVEITKVPLKVTAKDATITYGDKPDNNGVEYSGFVNDETKKVLKGTLSYNIDYEQYGDVGSSYSIVPKGVTAENYDITFVSGKLKVNPKKLTFTWNDADKEYTYNGKKQSVTAKAKTINDDVLTLTYSDNEKKNAGKYTAKITGVEGQKAANYKLSDDEPTASCDWEIAKKKMSVTANDVSVEYDEKEHGIEVKVTDPKSGYTITYGKEKGEYDSRKSPAITKEGSLTVYFKVEADNYITYTGSAKVTVKEKKEGTSSSSVELKEGTPSVSVNGLDEEAKALQEGEASDVTVTMSVEQMAEENAEGDGVTAIKNIAEGRMLTFFDIKVIKDVGSVQTVLNTTTNILEICIPYYHVSEEGLAAYRYHGSAATRLTESDSRQDGTYRVDKITKKVYIYTNQFSIYAIGYTVKSSVNEEGDIVYDISGNIRYEGIDGMAKLILYRNGEECKRGIASFTGGIGTYRFEELKEGNYSLRITYDAGKDSFTLELPIGDVSKQVAE